MKTIGLKISMNLVSIIILNRNNSSDVSRLLSELDEQSFKDFNVIIIDG